MQSSSVGRIRPRRPERKVSKSRSGTERVNSDIVTSSDEINKLRSNPDYNPVFRIIVTHNTSDDLDYLQQPTKSSISQLPNNVQQVALGGLQQQLSILLNHFLFIL